MKVCFVYSNRSEISILDPFINFFKNQIYMDVIDLSKEVRNLEIDKNLFKVYQKVYDKLIESDFDYLILFGDRRELPFVALAGLFSNTKIVHIGAGEYLEGLPTYDQLIRPVVSILSDYQICLSKKAKKKVSSLFSGISYLKPHAYFIGNPVFTGINVNKLKRTERGNYDLVLLHPQSFSRNDTEKDIRKLDKLLSKKKDHFHRRKQRQEFGSY